MVKYDGNVYQNISHAQRANLEIIEVAIRQGGGNPKYFSPGVRSDKELMMAAVENNPLYLEHGLFNIRSDFDVVSVAVMGDKDALEFVTDEIKNDPECMEMLLNLPNTKKRRRKSTLK